MRSILRAIDVLGLFDTQHPTRSLREIVAATGLPKTTAVRLLGTLESRGLVVRRGEVTYAPGAALLRWVRLAQSVWEVNAHTREVMRHLVDECGETVNIYVRQDLDRVSIAQEEGTATVRSVVEVGAVMPLSRGATAKVLLSGAPDAVVDRLGAVDPALDTAALRRQVAAVRETGYEVTHGERELGASAVAAPVLAADGRVLAAVSVSGPTSRFTADRVPRYVDAVTAAARSISKAGLGSVEAFL
ncbi:MAG TPA: IclR family transcriptional regulator [Nocardioidaceae bacterium]|nr:IclR family transcriptional regulator [Nocardioidaceae bacterium]